MKILIDNGLGREMPGKCSPAWRFGEYQYTRQIAAAVVAMDLVREENNQFDPYAVAIYYGDYKLGFIPLGQNHDISKYLDMGLYDIYDVRITSITPDVHPEDQVEVIVNIINQN